MHENRADNRQNPADLASIDGQLAVARTGDVPDRWNLASTYGIDAEVASVLAGDEDERVLQALANNYGVLPEVLATLAAKGKALRDIVARNPFAPPELKGELPLREHASLAISEFLDDMDASAQQRIKIMFAFNAALADENAKTTLSEAWREVEDEQ